MLLSFYPVVVSGAYSLVAVCRRLLLGSMGSRLPGPQQLQLLGPRAQAQYLWCLVALQYVGSSWTKD